LAGCAPGCVQLVRRKNDAARFVSASIRPAARGRSEPRRIGRKRSSSQEGVHVPEIGLPFTSSHRGREYVSPERTYLDTSLGCIAHCYPLPGDLCLHQIIKVPQRVLQLKVITSLTTPVRPHAFFSSRRAGGDRSPNLCNCSAPQRRRGRNGCG